MPPTEAPKLSWEFAGLGLELQHEQLDSSLSTMEYWQLAALYAVVHRVHRSVETAMRNRGMLE